MVYSTLHTRMGQFQNGLLYLGCGSKFEADAAKSLTKHRQNTVDILNKNYSKNSAPLKLKKQIFDSFIILCLCFLLQNQELQNIHKDCI